MNSNPASVGNGGCSRRDEAPRHTLPLVLDPPSVEAPAAAIRTDLELSARSGRPRREDALIVQMSSFTLSVLGPPKAPASVDLQEMNGDGRPPRSARVRSPVTEYGTRDLRPSIMARAAAAVSATSLHPARPEAKAASEAVSRATHASTGPCSRRPPAPTRQRLSGTRAPRGRSAWALE